MPVVGMGGYFFRAKDPEALKAWYLEHLGVGGQFEPQLARRLDEGEILVGQRQDRDFGEIDPLRARQHQQQIERAL